MNSMFSCQRKVSRFGPRRSWALLPAAVLGAWVALLPAESHAAPTCTTKPAICDRLAATRKQSEPSLLVKAQAPRAVVAQSSAAPTCATKPSVCARLEARGTRPAAAPVTLASDAAAGPRCSSKPAVCARLRLRASAPPMTLATTAADVR